MNYNINFRENIVEWNKYPLSTFLQQGTSTLSLEEISRSLQDLPIEVAEIQYNTIPTFGFNPSIETTLFQTNSNIYVVSHSLNEKASRLLIGNIVRKARIQTVIPEEETIHLICQKVLKIRDEYQRIQNISQNTKQPLDKLFSAFLYEKFLTSSMKVSSFEAEKIIKNRYKIVLS